MFIFSAAYAYKFELYLTYLSVGSKCYIVCPLFRNVTDAVKVVVGTMDDEDLFGDAGSGVATKGKAAETRILVISQICCNYMA